MSITITGVCWKIYSKDEPGNEPRTRDWNRAPWKYRIALREYIVA